VPLKLITAVGLVEELLAIISCHVALPTVVGSNSISSVVCCPGFNVVGNAGPYNVKLAPVWAAPLIVTGCVPVEVKVTG
jgi:hypothetical protein